jgi:hypothetical protein
VCFHDAGANWGFSLKRTLVCLTIALAISALYLFAWPSANLQYFAAIVRHLVAGIAFLVVLIFTLRPILRNGPTASRLGWLLLAVGGILGALLIYTGARRAEWPLLYAHIAASLAGCAFLFSGWAAELGFLAGGLPAGLPRGALCLAVAAPIAAESLKMLHKTACFGC